MRGLFFIFLFIPLIEIYLLIEIGSVLGAGATIFLVVGTAILGAILVRVQGLSTFVRVQKQLVNGESPAIEMLEGLFLIIAGALLLTPGFFTDAIGFVCLTPPLRRIIIRFILKRNIFRMAKRSAAQKKWAHSIDVEYKEID